VFVGELTAGLVVVAACTAAAATAVAGIAATVLGQLLRRLPLAALLAEE